MFKHYFYNMKKIFLALALPAALCFTGCYYDSEEELYGGVNVDCNNISAKFSTDIAPMIQTKCATGGCHNAASAQGGQVFESYNQIKAAAGRIRQRAVVERTMPKTGSLTTLEIGKLKCWIDAGAPNN
jgi:uncharacterized membrane protein